MSRSVEMEEAEEVLSRAMVASITGTRPDVSANEVAEVLFTSFELTDGDFTVHTHHPKDFLILFSSQLTKSRLTGDHFIRGPCFSLSLCPWSKLAHAGSGEFEYRGIPAQAWHLSTAEHILGESCWIECLHPRTRSRADLATFRLSGRMHDPAGIRRAAILEIVEQIPSRIGSGMPTIRTLMYPISVALAHAKDDRAPPHGISSDDAPGHDGDAGTSNGPGRSSRPGHAQRRGCKRRCIDAQPSGHADGMAMDDLGWRVGNRVARADGVAVTSAWPAPRVAVAPPPIHQQTVEMMPWSGQRRAHKSRRHARKGKGKRKQKLSLAEVQTSKAAAAIDVGPTGSVSPRLTPDGSPALAADPPEPSRILNSASPSTPEDNSAGTGAGSSDHEACRDLDTLSEIPDSQPVEPVVPDNGELLSGQRDALSLSAPDTGLGPTDDRSAESPMHAAEDGRRTAPLAPILLPLTLGQRSLLACH